MLVEPIQRPSQTIVIEHIGSYAFSQQMLDRLVRKKLGH